MSFADEFSTVDLILKCAAETRGVDAFALSLIKAERQARRLFTHLIYQYPAFAKSDVPQLRAALTRNSRIYFEGFFRGIDDLYPRTIAQVVGAAHSRLLARVQEAGRYRNKIFHGQLTSLELSREDLKALVADIREWCETLALGFQAEIAYDGFGRGSFHKSAITDLATRYNLQLASVSEYEDFLRTKVQRT